MFRAYTTPDPNPELGEHLIRIQIQEIVRILTRIVKIQILVTLKLRKLGVERKSKQNETTKESKVEKPLESAMQKGNAALKNIADIKALHATNKHASHERQIDAKRTVSKL